MDEPAPCYVFGDFRVETATRQLSKADGTPVALTPKVFDTLLLLVQNPGLALSKDAMIAAIWPNRVVEENNLTQNISVLRRVLGASPGDHRYILTEPSLGYRFVAAVTIEPLATGASGAAVNAVEAGPVAQSDAFAAAPRANAIGAPGPNGTARERPARSTYGIIGVLALGVLAALLWATLGGRREAPVPMASSALTLAILPFKPLVPGSRDEVLELGLADTLIAKLSANGHVVVRSLSAVRRFDQPDQDPMDAGRQLGVGAVLEGLVQRQAGQVRLNVRLLAVPSGSAIWAGTFDSNFTDVFALQDDIVEKVATALSLKIDRDERRRMAANYTSNVEAYQLYLDGRYHLQKATPPDLAAGIGYFARAIGIDPEYALAYVGLAEGYRRQPIISDADPQTVLPLAKAAAQHALKIDDTLAEAYVPLGFVSFWYDWDWQAAETQFKRGIELQQSFADAHFGYAALLSNLGRNDEALRESHRARELDPLSPLYVALEASFVAYAGHVDEARQQVDGVLRANPNFWIAHLVRGWLNMDAQRFDDAVADFTQASALSGGSQQAVSMLGFALARAGRTAEAQALLDSLIERAGRGYIPPTSIATIYCGLGNHERALEWLERGFDARDVRMTFLRVDQRWDALRNEPGFVSLMNRMNLPL